MSLPARKPVALDLPDRRTHPRHACSYPAVIRIDGQTVCQARVINISPGGAEIEFPPQTALPYIFKLIIPDQTFEADCEVRHKNPTNAGVMFLNNRREALARFG